MTERRTRMRRLLTAISVAGIATLVAACAAQPGGTPTNGAEEKPFFEGKTIRFIVPFAAGGGTDVSARQLAPLLKEHIPGNPNIQIENIEGAGSVLGANEFAATDPDGLTIMMTSASTKMPFLFGDPAVKYDFADFEPVVGVPSGAVQFVSPTTGVETPDDLFAPDTELIYGGIQPGGGDITRLLGFHLLGVDVKTVFGYDSRATLQIAFQQGEVNIDGQTAQTYIENIVPLVEEGSAVPVYSTGMIVDGELSRDPAFPDLPHLKELVEANGNPVTGEGWDAYKFLVSVNVNMMKPIWIHAAAPEEAKSALAQAFIDMEKSSEYQDTLADVIGYDFLVGDALREQAKILSDLARAAHRVARKFALEEFDADLSAG